MPGEAPMLREAAAVAQRQVLTGFVCLGLFWGAWGAALPAIEAHAGLGDGPLGVALLGIGLGALLTMRLTARLLDNFGRPAIVAILALFALAGVLPCLVRGLAALGAVMLFLGGTSGAVDVCINVLAVDFERGHGRSIMNTAHASFSASVVASSLVVAALRSLQVPVWALLLVSQGLILVAAVAVMPSQVPWSGDDDEAQPLAHPGSVAAIPAVLVFLGALGAIAYLVENAWQSWSAILLQANLGAVAGVSSLAPTVFAGAESVGRFLANAVERRIRPRTILATGALVAMVGSVLAAEAPSIPTALAALVVAGLGTSICAPIIIAVAGRTTTRLSKAGTVSSVISLSYMGFLVGPPIVGLLSDATSLPLALVVVGALAAVLALLSVTNLRLPAANRIPRRA